MIASLAEEADENSDLLEKLYTVDATYEPLPPITRIATLEGFLQDLRDIEANLSPPLRISGNAQRVLATLPTGVRECNALHMKRVLSALQARISSHTSVWASLSAVSSSIRFRLMRRIKPLQSCRPFLKHARKSSLSLAVSPSPIKSSTGLPVSRHCMQPYLQLTAVSTHHMSNTASLLLRLAMRARKIGSPLDRNALEAANGFLRCLIATHKLTEWDVAGSALRKIVSLLLMAEDELPEVRDVYKEVATALGMPIAGESCRGADAS